jgi:hypothetical protein
MNGIYKLGRIKDLVESEHSPAAFIVDTGIVMEVPDLDLWKTQLKNPVFVLPCQMPRELEHLKNNPEMKNPACAASD